MKKKPGPKKGKPTKPMTDKDFERVTGMIEIACTAEEIASVMGYSVDTLDRRLKERGFDNFADAYKRYSGLGKASLRRVQFQAAQGGNVTMMIWLGKQWLGQSDQPEDGISDDIADAIRSVINKLPG